MYHGEDEQEDFLVLSGECLLLIEGEERRSLRMGLRPLPGVDRACVRRRGDGPCAILASERGPKATLYPESELAQSHRAGVSTADEPSRRRRTPRYAKDVATPYREGWLPG